MRRHVWGRWLARRRTALAAVSHLAHGTVTCHDALRYNQLPAPKEAACPAWAAHLERLGRRGRHCRAARVLAAWMRGCWGLVGGNGAAAGGTRRAAERGRAARDGQTGRARRGGVEDAPWGLFARELSAAQEALYRLAGGGLRSELD